MCFPDFTPTFTTVQRRTQFLMAPGYTRTRFLVIFGLDTPKVACFQLFFWVPDPRKKEKKEGKKRKKEGKKGVQRSVNFSRFGPCF